MAISTTLCLKKSQFVILDNFNKYCQNFKILSLKHSVENLQ